MTNEARSSRMRNTDFSIARILANDSKSCCRETRIVPLDRDAIRDDDVARKRRKRAVEEEDKRDSERNERCCGRVPRYGKEERGDEEHINVEAQRNNDDKESMIRRNDLTWLQYTRYRPPKLPRRSFVEKRTKRRAGDHPRIPFSSSQLQMLEDRYKKSAYLSRNDVIEISATLRLPQSKIKIWFQNRRARQRRELLSSTTLETR